AEAARGGDKALGPHCVGDWSGLGNDVAGVSYATCCQVSKSSEEFAATSKSGKRARRRSSRASGNAGGGTSSSRNAGLRCATSGQDRAGRLRSSEGASSRTPTWKLAAFGAGGLPIRNAADGEERRHYGHSDFDIGSGDRRDDGDFQRGIWRAA